MAAVRFRASAAFSSGVKLIEVSCCGGPRLTPSGAFFHTARDGRIGKALARHFLGDLGLDGLHVLAHQGFCLSQFLRAEARVGHGPHLVGIESLVAVEVVGLRQGAAGVLQRAFGVGVDLFGGLVEPWRGSG
ncbi:hypothetical protein WJ972_28745 [Achromobacter insuavis]